MYLLLNAVTLEYLTTTARAEAGPRDYWLSIYSVSLVGVGTYVACLANGAAAGRDFVGKFFAVSLIMTIRFLLFILPLIAGWVYFSFSAAMRGESAVGDAFILVPLIARGLLLYYRIYRHMADLKVAPMAQSWLYCPANARLPSSIRSCIYEIRSRCCPRAK
jgi:hypothetical protein